jgi:hypothetical protein
LFGPSKIDDNLFFMVNSRLAYFVQRGLTEDESDDDLAGLLSDDRAFTFFTYYLSYGQFNLSCRRTKSSANLLPRGVLFDGGM